MTTSNTGGARPRFAYVGGFIGPRSCKAVELRRYKAMRADEGFENSSLVLFSEVARMR
jgi:hypothetical protein